MKKPLLITAIFFFSVVTLTALFFVYRQPPKMMSSQTFPSVDSFQKTASLARVAVYPSPYLGEPSAGGQIEIKVLFEQGSPAEKIDYLKIEMIYPADRIFIPEAALIDISFSGLGRVISLDSPRKANEFGKLTIELGAVAADSGPTTDQPLTVALVPFSGDLSAAVLSGISFPYVEIVNNDSLEIPASVDNL